MPQSPGGTIVCREPPAAEAGERIMKQGGNAFDAAVAVAFAQGVINPMSCGIGGTAEVNLFDATSRGHLLVGALGGAGEHARPDSFEVVGETPRPGRWRVKNHANYVGYRAVTIPTFVRVMGETHRLFGSLPWGDVVEPAIALAKDGFTVWPELAASWDPHAKGALDWPSGMETLTATEECARIYLREGRFYQAGETLRQADLANTLRQIAEHGAEEFYQGEIGQAIADDFAAHAGFISRDDLLRCYGAVERPLEGSYRNHTLHGSGPFRLEMFHLLEGFDLAEMGHNEPTYLDTLARCFQAVHMDRAQHMGDPTFVDVPTHELISKEYAEQLRRWIRNDEDIADVEPGVVPAFSTTAAVAMDASGNAVALKHSNGNSSGVVTPGLGFLYNNHMHNFNPNPGYRNSVAAGKHPHGAAGGPLLVCKDGQATMGLAHHSRAGTTSEVQVVLNMLEFGMDVQKALEAHRIHAEYARRTVFVDPEFPTELADRLKGLNTQEVVVGKITPAVAAVRRDPRSGELEGGSDPRDANGVATVP